jgi:hypothetical protein
VVEQPWSPSPPETREFRWSVFPDWHAKSLCGTLTTSQSDKIFFGESEDPLRSTMTITQLKSVKTFCHQCPVFVECLTHALTTPERHGVWAGTSKRTRMRILALVESGDRTIAGVVQDYLEGRERQYESIRKAPPA